MTLNKKKLHPPQGDTKGAAMVIVLCVMVLFFVLSLTIIFASSVMVGKARNDKRDKQCQILATSFTQIIEKGMTESRTYVVDTTAQALEEDSEDEPEVIPPTLDMKNMQDFVRAHIDRNVSGSDISPLGYSVGSKWSMTWGNAADKKTYHVNVDPDGSTELSEAGYSMYMEMYWTFADEDGYASFLRNTNSFECYQDIVLVVDVVCQNQDNAVYKTHTLFQLAKLSGSEDKAEGDPVNWYDYTWYWTMIGDKT